MFVFTFLFLVTLYNSRCFSPSLSLSLARACILMFFFCPYFGFHFSVYIQRFLSFLLFSLGLYRCCHHRCRLVFFVFLKKKKR